MRLRHAAAALPVLAVLAGCATTRTVVAIDPPPPWVDVLPKRPKTMCAVGTSGATFYQPDCVKNAADNARGQLAENFTATIRSITIDISDRSQGSFDYDLYVEGSEIASSAVLTGSEIEAQWFDRAGVRGDRDGCHVLVCVDWTKPLDSFLGAVQTKLPPKTVEQTRANAQAAFEELERAETKAVAPPPSTPEPAPTPEPPATPDPPPAPEPETPPSDANP